MATTITPLYEPGLSFSGIVVLAIAAAVALSAHLVARRRLRVLPRAKIRDKSRVMSVFIAFIFVEIVGICGALAALLNGAPALWTVLAVGVVGALSSAVLSVRGGAGIAASSAHAVVAFRPIAGIAYTAA